MPSGRNDAPWWGSSVSGNPWQKPLQTQMPDSTMGVLPVLTNPDDLPDRAPRSNAATAASAAGVRALSAQVVAFYFRAPAKAFFRSRVDYLAYARSLHHQHIQRLLQAVAADPSASRSTKFLRHTWLWMRSTTPGVVTSAIKHQGWSVVPHQILPPLFANVGLGAILYTSYLQILGRLHEGSGKASKRVYPPPDASQTFAAGFLAGGIQSVFAAPLDAILARYDHHDLMPKGGTTNARPKSMWTFTYEKLQLIGVRGIFAGWGLSFAKDSLGSAVFFSTFEYIKAQGYYRFVTWYYGGLGQDIVDVLAMKRPAKNDSDVTSIRPHYAIEPMFLLLAGSGASFSQQLLLHPLTHFQAKHWDHMEDLDEKAARYRELKETNPEKPRRSWRMQRAYYHAYQETLAVCRAEAATEGLTLAKWLYRGFWWNTIRQVPSTSAGLIIFELIRRKYGYGAEEVRITKDGYDILLH